MAENDPIHRPAHYANTQIEVANFIADRELDYFLGCVVKYVSRAGKKDSDKELEDLQKAQAYLGMKIRLLQGETPIPPRAPFCTECAGPYTAARGYAWLEVQHDGHWDTCPNRPKTVAFKLPNNARFTDPIMTTRHIRKETS